MCIRDRPQTIKEGEEGLVSTIGDEGLYGQACQVRTAPGGVTAAGVQQMCIRDRLKSLHQKKRYHRLRDGRLLRLDDSLEVLDELNETLELSGAKLGQNHAQLPLYRAPSLDWALSGQTGVRFNRDDAFRRISRSFHADVYKRQVEIPSGYGAHLRLKLLTERHGNCRLYTSGVLWKSWLEQTTATPALCACPMRAGSSS